VKSRSGSAKRLEEERRKAGKTGQEDEAGSSDEGVSVE
jgi:hypothetical protein